jgi:hypothetical protein
VRQPVRQSGTRQEAYDALHAGRVLVDRREDRATHQQQQVQQVGGGQRGFSAEYTGHEQPEGCESRRTAEDCQDHAERGVEAARRVPAEGEAGPDQYGELDRLDHQDRADLAGQQAGAGQR